MYGFTSNNKAVPNNHSRDEEGYGGNHEVYLPKMIWGSIG